MKRSFLVRCHLALVFAKNYDKSLLTVQSEDRANMDEPIKSHDLEAKEEKIDSLRAGQKV